MKNKSMFLLISCVFCFSADSSLEAKNTQAQIGLQNMYNIHTSQVSDIYEHIPTLRNLSRECSSVVEIGIRSMVSTWGVLLGLSESSSSNRFYYGIDLLNPPAEAMELAKQACFDSGIYYSFAQADDMTISIPFCDLLFIDSCHTYCHLTYELETFASSVDKYIVLHDTSGPWGTQDEVYYKGNYSEYPAHYDRNKKGLWLAVEDFLAKNPEWELFKRYYNCNGLTILRRTNG